MRAGKLILLLIFIFLPILPIMISYRRALAQTNQYLDLVIVIDNSGSMDNNDPRGLRYSSADMLVDLLSEQDRVGVVNFADYGNKVTPELTLLSNAQSRKQIKQSLEDARVNDPRNITQYAKALGSAASYFNNKSGNRQAVIFLTDGLPTDMSNDLAEGNGDINVSKLQKALSPFAQSDIPVFLMVLKDKSSYASIQGGVSIVAAEFEKTGPTAVEIDNPIDIVKAFAFVITQLLPDTYLDSLDGYAEGSATTRFQAHAEESQHVSRVTFVFVPPSTYQKFAVTALGSPPNVTQLSAGTIDNPNYSLAAFASGDNKPINGNWTFSTVGNNVVGFAFVQSDVELTLVYPSSPELIGRRVMVSNQSVLLGARIDGLAASPNFNIDIHVHTENCFAANIGKVQEQTYSLTLTGLSSDNTIYWSLIPPQTKAMYVDIILRQLDKPIRLIRCFPIQLAPSLQEDIQIVRPNATDTLVNGGIPLEISIPDEIKWNMLQAFVESPSGMVEPVTLDPTSHSGEAHQIDAPGTYKIRYLIQGLNVKNDLITLLKETSFTVSNDGAVDTSVINLGKISDLGVSLSGKIQISIPFAKVDTPISFILQSTRRVDDNQDVANKITLDLCSRPTIEPQTVSCDFSVTPANDILSGKYELSVRIDAPEQTLRSNTVTIKFSRPESALSLSSGVISLGSITPSSTNLVHSLDFNPILWESDPMLSNNLAVIELWDVAKQEMVSKEFINVDLRRKSTNSYSYELILNAGQNLPPGRYEAKVALKSSISTLNLEPNELKLQFDKPAATVSVSFEDSEYKSAVWGYPVPQLGSFLFPTKSYLPAAAITQFIVNEPTLASPVIAQIKLGEETLDPASIQLSWRNDGIVEGQSNQYKMSLIAQLVKPLAEGTYNLRISMSDPIRDPREKILQVHVYGWRAFFWQRFLPFLGILLVGWIGYRKIVYDSARRFNGILVLDNLTFDLSKYKNCQTLGFAKVDGKLTLVPNGQSKIVLVCESRNKIKLQSLKGSISLNRGDGKTFGIHRINYQ